MDVVAAIKGRTQSKTATGKVIAYVIQRKKTLFADAETGQKYRLISGQNCVAETAFKEFMATKIQYGKDNGVFYKQFVQSFKPGEAASPLADIVHIFRCQGRVVFFRLYAAEKSPHLPLTRQVGRGLFVLIVGNGIVKIKDKSERFTDWENR